MGKPTINELIKEFEEKSKDAISEHRGLYENDEFIDTNYNFDIHIWRETGMGNSLQVIQGNEISIMTGLTSLFETLINKGVLDGEDLENMVNLAIEHTKNK